MNSTHSLNQSRRHCSGFVQDLFRICSGYDYVSIEARFIILLDLKKVKGNVLPGGWVRFFRFFRFARFFRYVRFVRPRPRPRPRLGNGRQLGRPHQKLVLKTNQGQWLSIICVSSSSHISLSQ